MKILLIDDHVLIREALQGILKELRPDTTVLEAANCNQAMRLAEEHADLEVILLDLNLPDGDGFNLLAELRELYPAVSIVVLSATNDRDTVTRALDLGAVGFIPKSTQRAVMLSGLELTLAGGIYIPPEILAPHVSPGDHLGMTERQASVCSLNAGEEQQGNLSRAPLVRTDGKDSRGRYSEGLEGPQPHRGGGGHVSHERTRGRPQNTMNSPGSPGTFLLWN